MTVCYSKTYQGSVLNLLHLCYIHLKTKLIVDIKLNQRHIRDYQYLIYKELNLFSSLQVKRLQHFQLFQPVCC